MVKRNKFQQSHDPRAHEAVEFARDPGQDVGEVAAPVVSELGADLARENRVRLGQGAGQALQGVPVREHSEHHRRSEERRVGKECRSRWSPYH